MATTFNQTITANYQESIPRPTIITNFFNWCKAQEQNRLLWIGIALAGHGCLLTPLTGVAVQMAGNNMILFTLVIAAMVMVLVTNLAALPTKITIPVFILSVVVDIAIVIACATSGLDAVSIF